MEFDLNSLLFEGESSTLDFKREQYLFENADDIQKGELLKDILSFVNAWRQADAFILIGVEENKGGKSQVVGIDVNLDDANLQQFVNSKTQKPVNFSYQTISIENKKVGVIKIPIQKRPIYLKKSYGNLKANIVYVRRGTSTAEANPDEIFEMGSAKSDMQQVQPLILIEFSNNERVRYGTETEIETIKLLIPPKNDIPDYIQSDQRFSFSVLGDSNRNYYRELVEYYYWKYLCMPFIFYLENISEVSAIGIKVHLIVQKNDLFGFVKESEIPVEPYWDLSFSRNTFINLPGPSLTKSDTKIIEEKNRWIIEIEVPRLQPKSSYFSLKNIYFFSLSSIPLELETLIYADNLIDPIQRKLLLKINVMEKPGDLESIEKLHRESIIRRYEIDKKKDI